MPAEAQEFQARGQEVKQSMQKEWNQFNEVCSEQQRHLQFQCNVWGL
jgi:hypothetical protein